MIILLTLIMYKHHVQAMMLLVTAPHIASDQFNIIIQFNCMITVYQIPNKCTHAPLTSIYHRNMQSFHLIIIIRQKETVKTVYPLSI